MRVPLPFSNNRPENHSHNLGKVLGEGLGLPCELLHLSIPFTSLSLSTLYPFHLSIPFTSLSLSPLSLSLLSLPPSLYLSFYLSFSLSPSLCLLSSILFGVSNGRFRPCLISHLHFYFTINNIIEYQLQRKIVITVKSSYKHFSQQWLTCKGVCYSTYN